MKAQPMEWRICHKHFGLNVSENSNVTGYELSVKGLGDCNLLVVVEYDRKPPRGGWIIRYSDGRASATKYQTAEKAMSMAEAYLKRKMREAARLLMAEAQKAWPKDHSKAFKVSA